MLLSLQTKPSTSNLMVKKLKRNRVHQDSLNSALVWHTISSPARPKKPAPTMQSTKQKEKPQKPDASTKPYHDLAWAQFPQANGIRHSGSSLMHSYYNKNSDPRVTQMAQAVLQVPENAGEKAIGTAYENAISTFSTPEFTNSPALHKEIMKIIDTAYAILTQ